MSMTLEDKLNNLRNTSVDMFSEHNKKIQAIENKLDAEIHMRKDLGEYCLKRLGSPMYHSEAEHTCQDSGIPFKTKDQSHDLKTMIEAYNKLEDQLIELREDMDQYEKMEWTSTPLNNLATQYSKLTSDLNAFREITTNKYAYHEKNIQDLISIGNEFRWSISELQREQKELQKYISDSNQARFETDEKIRKDLDLILKKPIIYNNEKTDNLTFFQAFEQMNQGKSAGRKKWYGYIKKGFSDDTLNWDDLVANDWEIKKE